MEIEEANFLILSFIIMCILYYSIIYIAIIISICFVSFMIYASFRYYTLTPEDVHKIILFEQQIECDYIQALKEVEKEIKKEKKRKQIKRFKKKIRNLFCMHD